MRVRIAGTDRVFRAGPGDDLLEVFQSNDERIATACGGIASCGMCRVHVVSGGDALTVPRAGELAHLGDEAGAGLRLACQALLRTDGVLREEHEIVVRIPSPDET